MMKREELSRIASVKFQKALSDRARAVTPRVLAFCVMAVSLVFTLAVTAANLRLTYVTDSDGARQLVVSSETDPARVMSLSGIEAEEGDHVYYTAFSGNLATLNIERAFTVNIQADGQEYPVKMAFGTVAEALERAGITLEGDDMGILIGKRGQTLDSLQYLVSLIVNKGTEGYLRVKLDTENYRERRKETLETLAKNIAYKVKRTRRPVSLEPMNPYERRIIHAAVQNDKYVTTRSEGEEPFRHVVIALKKEAVSGERKGRYDRAGRGRSYGYKGNNRRGGSYQSAPKAEPVTETVSESAQE